MDRMLLFCSRMLATSCVCIAIMLVGEMTPPSAGRALASNEMAATFGDQSGCQLCKRAFPCDQGFKEGTDCVMCDDSTKKRCQCCEAVIKGTCDYTGASSPCNGAPRKKKPASTTSSSCNTCTGTGTWQGTMQMCDGLVEAKSFVDCPGIAAADKCQ
jgi:hypothetical protein